MHESSGWRGYVFSRKFDESYVPQRVQNIIIREHARAHNLKFLLSIFEYDLENSYISLESLLKELDSIDGIIFYSMNMLPKNALYRKSIFSRLLEKGKKLHFALEELKVEDWSDVTFIEDVLMIASLASHAHLSLHEICSFANARDNKTIY